MSKDWMFKNWMVGASIYIGTRVAGPVEGLEWLRGLDFWVYMIVWGLISVIITFVSGGFINEN